MGGQRATHLLTARGIMDPLQELWDLYEEVMEKPPLAQEDPSAMGTPTVGGDQHPVIQQRKQVDDLRAAGMDDYDAHQQVYGEVDLADPESKSKLAATLHRIQTDDEKRGVNVDKDATHKSLFAKEKEAEENNEVTGQDLKTPMPGQVPDALETQQEDWYNFDVSYLQTYGRA